MPIGHGPVYCNGCHKFVYGGFSDCDCAIRYVLKKQREEQEKRRKFNEKYRK